MKKLNWLFALLIITTSTQAAAKSELTLKTYHGDGNSFHVNSVLVHGDTEAIVIDAGFTKADALRIAANVLESGKPLTTIFISQADPDYYFGVSTLKQIFPQANVLTTPTVRAAIKRKMAAKLAYWGPKMAANAPDRLILPDAYSESQLLVDGATIEIKDSTGVLAHRPYLWIPSRKAIIGNVSVSNGLHVWTADVQKEVQWQAWLTQLEQMKALAPNIVVPGHMSANMPLTSASIDYTINYLNTFSLEKSRSNNASDLINRMTKAYPNAQLPIALSIGAKVHKGEMKW